MALILLESLCEMLCGAAMRARADLSTHVVRPQTIACSCRKERLNHMVGTMDPIPAVLAGNGTSVCGRRRRMRAWPCFRRFKSPHHSSRVLW